MTNHPSLPMIREVPGALCLNQGTSKQLVTSWSVTSKPTSQNWNEQEENCVC